ncbi:hypothetical protein BB561_001476 [Smittium simulii]|uniref:Zinc/iron permease n=1 Tax=Smittium simulii TaxID=133385 RepID=A0A2T9YUI2_9FUNG|nr:hypothetical protein BB561_001476 [Smittium simulii]
MFNIRKLFAILAIISILLIVQASLANVQKTDTLDIPSNSLYKRHGPPGTHDDKKPEPKADEHNHDHDHSSHSDEAESAGASNCSSVGVADYKTVDQIKSLFIVLFVGFIGVFLPIMGYKFESLKIPQILLNSGKFFGMGVILSVAIIHIYASAVGFLSHECVSNQLGDYESWAGVIFIISIFLMQFIDFLVLKKFGRPASNPTDSGLKSVDQNSVEEGAHIHTNALAHAHVHSHGQSQVNVYSDPYTETEAQKTRIKSISLLLLELSIIFHSLVVGLTLGLTDSSSLVTFTIAIAFHQLFEGFAIGDRLGSSYAKSIESSVANTTKRFIRLIVSGLAYSLSAPLGQAFGIAIHSSLNVQSPSFLILIGVLEAISAGILTYVVLIHMIAEEFSTKIFWNSSNFSKSVCFVSMYIGAAAMAVVGKWA